MIAVIWVNLRRAMGDRRLLVISTLVPVVIILITGLLEGSPASRSGCCTPRRVCCTSPKPPTGSRFGWRPTGPT